MTSRMMVLDDDLPLSGSSSSDSFGRGEIGAGWALIGCLFLLLLLF
jgi:hypothetical protein